MEREDFLETCVVLSGLDRESIIKTILKEKYKHVCDYKEDNLPYNHGGLPEGLPEGLPLLVYNPSPQNFAEYAFALCSLKDSKEAMTRHLLSIHFDAAVESAIRRPRVRTRQSKQKSADETVALNVVQSSPRKKKRSSPDSDSEAVETKETKESKKQAQSITLPSKLNLFLREDGKTPMATMAEIIGSFFPGVVLLWPGIYRSQTSLTFVLLVADNGRYKNCWKSAGIQNRLTWYTSSEDVDRKVFDMIADQNSVVHVVRKRNSEMRYMGKCQKTEDVDKEDGSCVMYVA